MAEIKYYFGDNREYGAEDIKSALSVLVAEGGIALDLSGDGKYDISALNSIVGSAVEAGVVPDSVTSLKLAVSDGRYSVSPGRAVFSDGGIAVLDGEESVDMTAGQYLYLAYSTALDDVYFLASDEEQSEGNGTLLVPIGYSAKDGGVESLRRYARGKIPALASASWSTLREAEFTIDLSEVGKSGGFVECTHEFDGEMNFMLLDAVGFVSTMYTDAPKYHTVYKMTSKEHGDDSTFFGVKYTANGFIMARLVEKESGRIKMRYTVPSGISSSSVTYRPLIGLVK